ncbi:MAG: CDP-diacylglycerol--glycerol-3-phosphate 3-phosphatidyltransferase [Anaerofustis stercorihominis]|nr:CDP-diacylglycerol--glycerol-3-phosphate 3-phosphatidyltransferase [Anaerofustis stercorihominis]
MNLPNKITLFRVILIPVYFAFMYMDFSAAIYIAGVIYILASITDSIDGYIARKHNLVTDFGKFMDPLADKLLVITSLVIFCANGRIAAWGVVIVIARELAITSLRTMAALEGTVMAADKYGKIKTITQMLAISAMHFEGFVPVAPIVNVVYYFSILMTIISGVNYFIKNKNLIKTM